MNFERATYMRKDETLGEFAERLRRQYADLAKAVGFSVDELGDVKVEHMAVLRVVERAVPGWKPVPCEDDE